MRREPQIAPAIARASVSNHSGQARLSAWLRARADDRVAALEEAGALGKQLGAWGDLSHIGGKLAAVRLRMGDLAGARADLERAEAADLYRRIGMLGRVFIEVETEAFSLPS